VSGAVPSSIGSPDPSLSGGNIVKNLLCVCAMLAVLLVFAGPSSAGTVSQQFIENGLTFDSVQLFVFTPGGLAGPGLSAFSDASWSNVNNSDHWATASGNEVTSLYFNLNFDYSTLPVVVHLYAFDAGVLGDSAQFTYNGRFEQNPDVAPLAEGQYQRDVAASTPEPATFGLIGAGLIGLGFRRRRGTKKA
jgi:hypothetical protein